jgi:hypothetical protein
VFAPLVAVGAVLFSALVGVVFGYWPAGVAYTDGDGTCTLGRSAVESIEADPAFFLSVAVHEIAGHREFERGHSVSAYLYQLAAGSIPGYVEPEPGSPEAEAEWQRYTYFESEIGALLREHAHWVEQTDKGQNPGSSPTARLAAVLRQVKDQWAPELRAPLFRGLATRFAADPRISEGACQTFEAEVQAVLGLTLGP